MFAWSWFQDREVEWPICGALLVRSTASSSSAIGSAQSVDIDPEDLGAEVNSSGRDFAATEGRVALVRAGGRRLPVSGAIARGGGGRS